ncbi:MAG TPA: hypothetical protein VIJ71_06810 [Mycobacteriales bacterium]
MPSRPAGAAPDRGGDPITQRTGRYQLPPPEDPGRKGLYRPNRRVLYGLLVLLGLLAIGRAYFSGGHGQPNLLPTSCTTPAVALRDSTVGQGDTLGVVAVGPADAIYSIYLDVSAVRIGGDGKPVGVPEPGTPTEQAQLLIVASTLPGCRAEGSPVLNGQIRPGAHLVTLLRHNPDGTQTLVASTPLTIR